ncbi:MAG: SDR family oxidoreductase [Clostridiales bacterium]|jgi:short-subunit dehydrogenase|nr:SDR family oxidoreductase [Clostridiales bacterium]
MTALITGASSGIGRDMARYLGSMGWNLILTARNKAELYKLKDELKQKYNNKVAVIPLDLAEEKAPFKLYHTCKNKKIDMLINNAGFGVFGNFTKTSLDSELEMLKVNIRAVHILTKLFLTDFKRRNHGIILNTSSSAGFMPGPLFSSYYASKSYILNLTLAIHEELRREKSNVKICVLCPGPVETNFNNRAGVRFDVKPASSECVAKYGIDNALKGNPLIIPTLKMKICVLASRITPYNILNSITYNIQHKKQN